MDLHLEATNRMAKIVPSGIFLGQSFHSGAVGSFFNFQFSQKKAPHVQLNDPGCFACMQIYYHRHACDQGFIYFL